MKAVRVLETSVVVPSEATPVRRLWVSSLDVNTVGRGYTPVMYLYSCKPDASSVELVKRLKAALADALVPFYPVAGRLAADSSGRPEIDCNGEGALFVVARSDDLTADYVREFAALTELKRLFVPTVESREHPGAIFAVQLTFLKCGGVVMGTALNHVIGDALSAFNFIRTWCMIACGSKLDEDLPCHDRRLLSARSPPVVDVGLHTVLSPKMSPSAAVRPVVFKAFHVSADQVADLKLLCRRTSTFRAVTAHVWRCVCTARGLAPGSRARISFLASVRRRMRPRLPVGYFGNTTIMLSATAPTNDILTGTLSSISDKIGGTVDRLDNDLAHSAIDYLELASRAGADEPHPQPHPSKEGSSPETDLKVVSWLGMPMGAADFGLGKPDFTRPPDGSSPGVVLLVSGEGGAVIVSAYLEPGSINLFEKLLSATPAY